MIKKIETRELNGTFKTLLLTKNLKLYSLDENTYNTFDLKNEDDIINNGFNFISTCYFLKQNDLFEYIKNDNEIEFLQEKNTIEEFFNFLFIVY